MFTYDNFTLIAGEFARELCFIMSPIWRKPKAKDEMVRKEAESKRAPFGSSVGTMVRS